MENLLFELEEIPIKKSNQPRTPSGEWVKKSINDKYQSKIDSLRETIKYMAHLNAGLVRKLENIKKQTT